MVTDEVATENTKTKSKTETKKSKKGLIIGLAAGAIAVVAGAVALVFFVQAQNSPENVALDAITKTIKEPAHTITSTISMSVPTTNAYGDTIQNSIEIALESENNGINASSSATFRTKIAGMNDFTFTFNDVLQDDGVLYIRTQELSDFLSSLASNFSAYTNTEPVSTIVTKIKLLGKKIDANWWRISFPEVMKSLGAYTDELNSQYNCVVGATKELFSQSGLDTIANIYKDHQFLVVKKASSKPVSFTGDAYEATADVNKLSDFWNGFMDSSEMKKIRDCAPSSNTAAKIVSSQLNKAAAKPIYLDINNSRVIEGVYFDTTVNGYNVKLDLRLKAGAAEIITPANSHPISELTAEITELVQSISGLFSAYTVVEQSND